MSDSRKTDLAYGFSDRFGYSHRAFIRYLREEGITPEGSYQATWEAIQQGSESLRRHSNLLLLSPDLLHNILLFRSIDP